MADRTACDLLLASAASSSRTCSLLALISWLAIFNAQPSNAQDLEEMYQPSTSIDSEECTKAIAQGTLVTSGLDFETTGSDGYQVSFKGSLYLFNGSFVYVGIAPYFGILPAPHFHLACWKYSEPQ